MNDRMFSDQCLDNHGNTSFNSIHFSINDSNEVFLFDISSILCPLLYGSCTYLFDFIIFAIPSFLAAYAQEESVDVEPIGESDDIDDILEANIEEPEEADDDITYDADEDEPIVMKTLNFNMHPLTDIPEPSSDIEVTYKFLSGI